MVEWSITTDCKSVALRATQVQILPGAQNMSSIFTRIINREIPADIFYEDDNFIAFLDINPVRDGHTLVVPKFKDGEKEEDYIFNLNEEKYLELMITVKKVANILQNKLKGKLDFEKLYIGVEGLEIPHVHVHLIPLTGDKGFHFEKEAKLNREEILNILLEDGLNNN